MKKLLLAVMAFLFLCACSGEQDMIYRGLSMKMPCNSFINEMAQRGFAIDSAAAPDSTGRVIVMKNPAEKYHIIIGQKNDTIQAIREIYKISTNDSTRRLWQQLRDG